jgi:hypothetical protein
MSHNVITARTGNWYSESGCPKPAVRRRKTNRITALDMRQSSAMRRALPNARDSFSRDQFQSNVPETRGIRGVEGVWSDDAASRTEVAAPCSTVLRRSTGGSSHPCISATRRNGTRVQRVRGNAVGVRTLRNSKTDSSVAAVLDCAGASVMLAVRRPGDAAHVVEEMQSAQ